MNAYIEIPFNPVQTYQFVQMEEPDLPDFLYHFKEDEDPACCFTMTNPYEAIFTHDAARTCVHVAPDILHSFQPPTDLPSKFRGTNLKYIPLYQKFKTKWILYLVSKIYLN